MLYVVKLSNSLESIIKVGFTKHNTTSKRFQPYRKIFDKVEVIKLFVNKSVDYKSLEKHFNTTYAVKSKVRPLTVFGGMTECYRVADAELLLSMIIKLEGKYPVIVQPKVQPDIRVSDFFEEDETILEDKQLFTASHWVDPETGEEVKLTHNMKAVYHHKLDQYRSFRKKGQVYRESAQRVADILGISVKTVEDVSIPLLKRMGLIFIDIKSPRNCITTMYPLKHLRGYLINKKLEKHNKSKGKVKKEECIEDLFNDEVTPRDSKDFIQYKENVKSKDLLQAQLKDIEKRLAELDNDMFSPKPKKVGFKMKAKETVEG